MDIVSNSKTSRRLSDSSQDQKYDGIKYNAKKIARPKFHGRLDSLLKPSAIDVVDLTLDNDEDKSQIHLNESKTYGNELDIENYRKQVGSRGESSSSSHQPPTNYTHNANQLEIPITKTSNTNEIDIQESDDDVMVIDPKDAAELTAFKTKAIYFNQPAPVPHWGSGSKQVDHHKYLESEKLVRINNLTHERNTLLEELTTTRIQLTNQHNLVIQLTRNPESSQDEIMAQRRILEILSDKFQRILASVKSRDNDLNVLKYGNVIASQEERHREEKRRMRRLKLEQLQKQAHNLIAISSQLEYKSPGDAKSTTFHSPTTFNIYNNIQNRVSLLPPQSITNNGLPIRNPYMVNQELPYMTPVNGNESFDIKNLISNILPEDELSEQDLAPTPEGFSTTLLKHQRIGLSWLLRMEKSSTKGGILADDMGLGKTIQALALIVANKSQDINCKTTLIVAPVSLLRQWKSEIEDKLKRQFQLSIGLYHSVSKAALSTPSEIKQYDVILTSYGTLSSEYSKDSSDTKSKEYHSPLYHKDMKFYRVILDEAQFIKNKSTKASKACDQLQVDYRLVLTGTPMQNNIDELYPLIRFLKAKPYVDEAKFRHAISDPIKARRGVTTDKAVERLQVLLKAICLRRTKDSLIDGKPILQLPEKLVNLDKLAMDEEEFEQYKRIENTSKGKALEMMNTNGYGWSHMLVLLTRLRQACLHTFLCELSSVSEMGKFKRDNWKVLLTTIMNLDPITVSKLKTSFLKENGETEPLSTKQLRDELKLISDTQVETEQPKTEKTGKWFICPLCSMPVSYESTVGFPCGHEICEFCVDDFLGLNGTDSDDGDKAKCMSCAQVLRMTDLIDYKMFHLRYMENVSQDAIARQYYSSLEEKKMSTKEKIMTLIKRDDGLTPSTKMSRIIELIKEIQVNYPGEKVIVFSQFTSFFEIFRFILDQEKIPFLRYDGSMSVDKKDFAVRSFYNDNIPVMLTSLKAGNAGLTLTCASHVILCDPFWNPFVEEQAMARAHRLGQQREVHVHRIIIEGTIEERIVKLQKQKKEIIDSALNETGISKVSKLGRRELGFLFGLNDL